MGACTIGCSTPKSFMPGPYGASTPHEKRSITIRTITPRDGTMELADLAVFGSVARTGTMTGAAAELMTVQSNVTARVRLLERELGVALFDRHSRGVTLTAAGQRLLPFAERIR